MSKLKNVVVLDKKTLTAIANGEKKIDKRKSNPGRPVNRTSARQLRLAQQSFYETVNAKFYNGNEFTINNDTKYRYDNKNECIVETAFNTHCANVSYFGRTKVKAYSFTLGKKVNVELNLKTLKFVK